MSLLTSPSSASKTLRKPDKEGTIPAHDYSISVEKAEGAELGDNPGPLVEVNESPSQPNEASSGVNKNDKVPRKPYPTPVVQVDPLEFIEPDEHGAELGKEARVWKVYTKETNQWDAELVDGWNKSLDVILVFAALFSAISTAFLIESSKMLKEDPADVSAAALLTISQTLSALANNSSAGTPASDTGSNAAPTFVPSRNGIIVNILWYLSLSLSVATSLLAMLAKEWCHSFTTGRTGHPWDQALRRQRKWMMIEKWKMGEFIGVLPSLIHLSLLLFATGLCIYVWDLNSTVAIPIIVITGTAFTFYIWSSLMASLVQLFPYTTIISRAIRSDFAQLQIGRISPWVAKLLKLFMHAIKLLISALILLPFVILDIFIQCFSDYSICYYLQTGPLSSIYEIFNKYVWTLSFARVLRSLRTITLYLGFKPTALHWDNQELVKSLALKWLIQNCETPTSISIALQAIAGASSRIPKKPLEECQATLHIVRRLAQSNTAAAHGAESSTSLYTRALAVLGSGAPSKQDISRNGGAENIEVLLRDFQSEHERQVGELISDREFRPNEDNLNALLLGNTAADLPLRLLKGEDDGVTDALDSVISLLLDHIQSGNQKLDTAASHSLANAAMVLTTCSDVSILSRDIVQRRMQQMISSFRDENAKGEVPSNSQLGGVLNPEIALLACILLSGAPGPQATADELRAIMASRTELAIRTLMDDHWKTPSSWPVFYRVGLLEVIFNPGRYNITWKTDSLQTEISQVYWESELLPSRPTLRRGSKNPSATNGDTEVIEFLRSTERVYDFVVPSTSHIPLPITLPLPTYCTLICAASSARSASERARCDQLLSKSVFLKLSHFSMASMSEFVDWLWYTYLEDRDSSNPEARSGLLSRTTRWRAIDSQAQAQSWHIAATQLWLLFHFSEKGNFPTQQQQALKRALNRGHSTTSKSQLEEEILRAYDERNHLGIYSARIIECILLAPDRETTLRNYDQVSSRISRDLQGVPSCLRGLSSLSDTLMQRADNAASTHATTSPFPLVLTAPGPTTPMSLINTDHLATSA